MMKKLNSANYSIKLIVFTAVLLVLLIIWASLSEITQTARAQGQIIAIARTQQIQAAIDGVIESIDVQEGEVVKKQQVLVHLDKQQVEAGLRESQGKVAALKAALVRLRTEVLGRPLIFPDELKAYPLFVENQTELLTRRQSALKEDVSALQKSLMLVNKELALNRPLLSAGDVGQSDIIRLERQAADISGQIATRRNKYFQDAQAEMTKAEEDLSTQESVLSDRLAVFERANIFAPTNGIVKNIQISTSGARVRPGDLIMELLPTGGVFLLEAKLKPADIATIRSGLSAQIKLDAYDYSIYGSLIGTVSYISPDALTERTPQGDVSYYRVQIKIDPDFLANHNKLDPSKIIEIQPGMTGTVDIETGKHSILSYLTKPVTKVMTESMNER